MSEFPAESLVGGAVVAATWPCVPVVKVAGSTWTNGPASRHTAWPTGRTSALDARNLHTCPIF